MQPKIAKRVLCLARGQGFEPRLPGPKPGVLPLDDPRIIAMHYIRIYLRNASEVAITDINVIPISSPPNIYNTFAFR